MNAPSRTSKTSLLALAVAGALTCTSALASNMGWPSSVNESAPSVQAYAFGPVHEPVSMNEPELNTDAPPLYVVEVTEYWMIGSDSHPSEPAPEVGSTSSTGGGTVGFDSTSSVDSTSGVMSTRSAAGRSSDLPREIVFYTPEG